MPLHFYFTIMQRLKSCYGKNEPAEKFMFIWCVKTKKTKKTRLQGFFCLNGCGATCWGYRESDQR